MKTKYFSADEDFKTGLIYKIFFLLSGILIALILIIKGLAFAFSGETEGFLFSIIELSSSSFIDISIAIVIIFIGLGGIAYFFHRQFSKLADIAKEIENESQ